jgi:hypothetical protein
MKRLSALIIFTLSIALFSIGTSSAETVNLGEVLNLWIQIGERGNAAFTIQTANYAVLNTSGYTIQTEATATIDNTNHYVYGLVNTGTSQFTADLTALVRYRYYIGSETRIYYKLIEIKGMSYTP